MDGYAADLAVVIEALDLHNATLIGDYLRKGQGTNQGPAWYARCLRM